MILSGAYALLLLLLVAAAAAASGRKLLVLAGLAGTSPAERTLIGATLGLGVLCLGTMVLAVLGLLNVGSAVAMLAGMALWAWRELRDAVASWEMKCDYRQAAGLLGVIALGLLWCCLMPPHQYDSLVYHLVLPEAYVREGRLVSPGHLIFSHFPQNAEMLFTLALLFKSEVLAQMFMWLAAVLSAWWVYEAGRREIGAAAAWLSVLLLATHTAVMLLATITYVEALVMLWTTAAVLSLWRWSSQGSRGREHDSRQGPAFQEREGQVPSGQGRSSPEAQVVLRSPAGASGLGRGVAGRGWLVLSAAFVGLALGVKYTAGVTAVWLALAPAARALLCKDGSYRLRGALADTSLFFCVTTVVFLPWLLKNAVVIGNPVFPFLYSWFPMTGTGWGAETAQRYFRILSDYGHGGNWIRDFLALPYQMIVGSPRFGGGMDVLGCLGWGLILLCVPLGFVFARPPARPFLMAVGVYSACHFLVWFVSGTVLRFLTSIAPLLALLAGAGLHGLWQAMGRRGRPVVAFVAGALIVMNLGYFLYVHALFESDRVLTGTEDRGAFLRRRLDYHSCAAWCRDNLGRNDRILIVGEQRAYNLDRDHVASTVNAPNAYVAWANEAESPKALQRRLEAEGFTAALFVPREWRRLKTAFGDLTPQGERNLDGLLRGLTPAYHGRACVVLPL